MNRGYIDWTCRTCGSEDPHSAIELPLDDPEIEIDVTCETVYITPIDGGNGFAFTHDEFEMIIEHFRESREQNMRQRQPTNDNSRNVYDHNYYEWDGNNMVLQDGPTWQDVRAYIKCRRSEINIWKPVHVPVEQMEKY